jgi:ATP-dependent Clp protease ATP-binding subunit ClpA
VDQAPEFSSFGRYSTEALRVLFAARHELARLGGAAVLPEHILLAALEPNAGSSLAALTALGLPIDALREELEGRLRTSSVSTLDPSEVPLSEGAKAVLDKALEAAPGQIASKHLLAGLLEEGKSAAAELLRAHGVALEHIR